MNRRQEVSLRRFGLTKIIEGAAVEGAAGPPTFEGATFVLVEVRCNNNRFDSLTTLKVKYFTIRNFQSTSFYVYDIVVPTFYVV